MTKKAFCAMEPDERAAIKAAYLNHAFMRVLHPLGEAIIALPREQTTEEKREAVSLYHGATVRIGYGAQDQA